MRKLTKGRFKRYRFYRTDFSGRQISRIKKNLSILRYLKLRFFYKRRFRYKIMELGGIIRRRTRRTINKVWTNAKQQFRNFYWNVKQTQFKRIIVKAKKKRRFFLRSFLGLLESRLDVIVFRMSYGLSMHQIRQVILHGFVLVNQVVVTFFGKRVRPGDYVSFAFFGPLFKVISHSFFLLGGRNSNLYKFSFLKFFNLVLKKQRAVSQLVYKSHILKQGIFSVKADFSVKNLSYFKVVTVGKPSFMLFLGKNVFSLFFSISKIFFCYCLGFFYSTNKKVFYDIFFDSVVEKVNFIRKFRSFFRVSLPRLLVEFLFSFIIASNFRDKSTFLSFRTTRVKDLINDMFRQKETLSLNSYKNQQKLKNKNFFDKELFVKKIKFVVRGQFLVDSVSVLKNNEVLLDNFCKKVISRNLVLSRPDFVIKKYNFKKKVIACSTYYYFIKVRRLFFLSKLFGRYGAKFNANWYNVRAIRQYFQAFFLSRSLIRKNRFLFHRKVFFRKRRQVNSNIQVQNKSIFRFKLRAYSKVNLYMRYSRLTRSLLKLEGVRRLKFLKQKLFASRKNKRQFTNRVFFKKRYGFKSWFKKQVPYPGNYIEISFKLLTAVMYRLPVVKDLHYPFRSSIFRLIDMYYV